MNFTALFIIAFLLSLVWVWAMTDLLRRDDLSKDQNTMWFAVLLVGNLAAAIVYLVWRLIRLLSGVGKD